MKLLNDKNHALWHDTRWVQMVAFLRFTIDKCFPKTPFCKEIKAAALRWMIVC